MNKKKSSSAVPKEHWEMRYNMHEPSKNMVATSGADFIPKRPKDRKTTHLKVNETDT